MRVITDIVVHCSDTDCGTEESIKNFHVNTRHWKDIGYHYVILNGKADSLHSDLDGCVVAGRPEDVVGAHVEGHNESSIGICLVGVKEFTPSQMHSLQILLLNLCIKYGLTSLNVHCHYEYDTAIAQGKTCPNIEINQIRKLIEGE